MKELISISEAIEKKITKLKQPKWANKEDHIEITICKDNSPGVWVRFYSPLNQHLFNKNFIERPLFEFNLYEKIWEKFN